MEQIKTIANIHVLLVEDDADYLEILIERLELLGYKHITFTRSGTEAKQILSERYFDVVVIDMRMENDDKRGFAVIEAVRQGNLSSIAIVLTANDRMEDCIEALKWRGAWDYISKNVPNSSGVEELHKSIQAALTYLNRWGNIKDETWIQEHFDELLAQYAGKWIAVFNNAVIEFADSQIALENTITERHLPSLTLIKQIKQPIPEPLSAELTVFVEGPTDVPYIAKALSMLGRDDLLKRIELDGIGDKSGKEGGGFTKLTQVFKFFKNKPKLRQNKVLFLYDPEVEIPNEICDVENVYVRRMDERSPNKKGIESLFPAYILEEGFDRNFVKKELTITKRNPEPKPRYEVTHKMQFCDWICNERDNRPDDFLGFQKIIEMIDAILGK